ncbi:MAG TPA: YSC84-related protein [Terriglobales bacterium]
MKKILSFVASIALLTSIAAAGTEGDRAKLEDRLDASATIINEIMAAPDSGIPEEILDSAKCVAVIPSMIKAGLGFGGQYGQGVVTCRTQAGWSAPAFYRLGGGSFGLQIGGQAVDLVMLFMNDRGMQSLLTHKVKLGIDAAAAAGPVGRHAAAETDVALRSEVLTYSRTRGLFAGISLNGSWVEQNDRDTRDFYGRYIPFQTILKGFVPAPPTAQNFVSTITRYSMPAAATQAAKPPAPATLSQRPAQGTATSPAQSQVSGAQPPSRTPNSTPAQNSTSNQNQSQTTQQSQPPAQSQMQTAPQGTETSTVPK